jgi:SNF2 family DNA or RNA helicase
LEGILFLWDRVAGKNTSKGCILAHSMGLGKTAQIVIFSESLLRLRATKYRNILILTPKIIVENWKLEYLKFSRFYKTSTPLYTMGKFLF